MQNIACIFPGQGSQSVGMLAALADAHPEVKATFAESSNVLGYDLWALAQAGPIEKQGQTLYTQPLMLTAGVAAWRVMQKQLPSLPAMCAGHSLGEYSALVCAQALAFSDAVALVNTRAQLMQETMPEGLGAMAAIVGMNDAQVADLCEQAAEGETLSPANFNSPGQVVIAGHTAAVKRAIEMAKDAKLARLIPVSVPCHCDLLQPAADAFETHLADTRFAPPKMPVIRNIDAKVHSHPDDIRTSLKAQLYKPVQWVKTIEAMVEGGVSLMFEPGPGRVLTGLNKRINRQIKTYPIYDVETLATLNMEELL